MTETNWMIGFGSRKTWWSYCSVRAADADTALARARREVWVTWHILNLHKGGDAPSVPEKGLLPLDGFPAEDDEIPDGAGFLYPALKVAGYGKTLEPRDHPWDAAHAREAVRAILRMATAKAGMPAAPKEVVIRHCGYTKNPNGGTSLTALNIRCDIEIRSLDGRLESVALPYAMRAALGACATAMLASNPEMNAQEIGRDWPEDRIALPRSASARAVLRDELAASAKHDATIVTDLLNQLRLKAEADAFLQCLERLP